MAKAPSKRRGITLGPRAQDASSIELLTGRPSVAGSLTSNPPASPIGTEVGDAGADPDGMTGELARLGRMSVDLDIRWRRQAEQLREHLQRLEHQGEQLAAQSRQLQALEQAPQTPGRLGVLLSLLPLAAVAALGFHTWPRLQEVAADLSHVSADVRHLAPDLQAVRLQVSSLTSEVGKVGSTMASLRENISGVRSDVGSLRQTVGTLPKVRDAVAADATGARGVAHAFPRQVAVMTQPYWAVRPMMPW